MVVGREGDERLVVLIKMGSDWHALGHRYGMEVSHGHHSGMGVRKDTICYKILIEITLVYIPFQYEPLSKIVIRF